jgi:hypothetical protein
MLVIKFINKRIKENTILAKTITKLADLLKKDETLELSLIRDSGSVEIVSGNLSSNTSDNNDIVVELTIKKSILLKEEDLADKQKLDKLVKEIVHFYEQSADIEELKYLPINYR